jgi:NADH-quinone oxidoreductase subunit J
MENLALIYFCLFATISVACASIVLFARHPINAAMALIGLMTSLSGIYAILHAPFLAVLQVLVYAGAIIMLLVFVIMVLNAAKDDHTPRFDALSGVLLLVPAGILAVLVHAFRNHPVTCDPQAVRGTVDLTGQALFNASTGNVVLFEAVGLALLSALVGAVLLAKRNLDSSKENKA